MSTDETDATADGPVDRAAEPLAGAEAAARAATEDERRRRRAQVFGDVLPDSTSDERGDGWSERDRAAEPGAGSEEWLRRQVPPHHG